MIKSNCEKWMESFMFLLQNDKGFRLEIRDGGWEDLDDLQNKIENRLNSHK